MGKGSKQTSTQSVTVPKYLENELKYGLSESRSLYDQGPASYEEMFAGFDPLQIEAMNGILAQARTGTDQMNLAKQFITNTLSGQSGQNPYLQQMMDANARNASNNVMSKFNATGRFGSGANAATAGKAITDATMPLLFDQYNRDEANKFSAAAMAQQFSDYDFGNLSKIASIGDLYQGQEQQRLSYEAGKEGNWLDQYLARVNGSGANALTTQTNTQSKSGGIMDVLGPALMIGGMFATGGALNPATAGGLGSMFGFGSSAGAASTGMSTPALMTSLGW